MDAASHGVLIFSVGAEHVGHFDADAASISSSRVMSSGRLGSPLTMQKKTMISPPEQSMRELPRDEALGRVAILRLHVS